MGAVQVPVVLEQVLDTIQIVADDPQRQSPPVDTNPSAEQAAGAVQVPAVSVQGARSYTNCCT